MSLQTRILARVIGCEGGLGLGLGSGFGSGSALGSGTALGLGLGLGLGSPSHRNFRPCGLVFELWLGLELGPRD